MKTLFSQKNCMVAFLLLMTFFFAAVPASGSDNQSVWSVRIVEDELLYDVDHPIDLLLSKSRYPAEDLHLDAIIWIAAEAKLDDRHLLTLVIRDRDDAIIWQQAIDPIPHHQLFIAAPLPSQLHGQEGRLEVTWSAHDVQIASISKPFSISKPKTRPQSGRVRIEVPNDTKAVLKHAPVTTGIPFPQGVLHDEANVRLLDDEGQEIPLQTSVTGRWSRYGSIRWVKADFVTNLDGSPKTLFLEYGPDIERTQYASFDVDVVADAGLPRIANGRLALSSNGMTLNMAENGLPAPIFEAGSLSGAYVEHADGTRYVMPSDTEYVLEEVGSEKVTIRAKQWFTNEETGDRFCQFVIRYVIRRDSPLVQIFYTWIFTGDAYEDQVRNVGWRFDLPEGSKPIGFLSHNEHEGDTWLRGQYQLHHDYDKYILGNNGEEVEHHERAPGVAGYEVGDAMVFLGVQDFWQRFPHELELAEDAIYYHLWPRHGRTWRDTVRLEEATRLWFAHQGEVMDLAIPEAYTREPMTNDIARSRLGPAYTFEGRRQTHGNAQGISQTTELWLYVAPSADDLDNIVSIFHGLQQRSLNAIVDPVWVAASGAFYEMHPKDEQRYPELEKAYELQALAPYQWNDAVGLYGKWVWGTAPWNPLLREGRLPFYRSFRKSHQGWPYSWLPFARSGDLRMYRLADAATRFQTDVAFVHYSDERVGNRPRGWWTRSHYPWADNWGYPKSRSRECVADYLWHSYYLTDYPRAKDVLDDFHELIKYQGAGRNTREDDRTVFERVGVHATRTSVDQLQTFVDMYYGTFDPWYLAAMHQVARVHKRAVREEGWHGHIEGTGPRDYHRFTGCEEYGQLVYTRYAASWSSGRVGGVWPRITPVLEPAAYGYVVSGDAYFLGRLIDKLDQARWGTYQGQPILFQGLRAPNTHPYANGPAYTGYFLKEMPFGLAIAHGAMQELGAAGLDLQRAIPQTFYHRPAMPYRVEDGVNYYRWRIAVERETEDEVELQLVFTNQPSWLDGRESYHYMVQDVDGHVLAQGEKSNRDETTITLPPDETGRQYLVTIDFNTDYSHNGSIQSRAGLSLPISPLGFREVLVLDEDEQLGRSHHFTQYWFHMPPSISMMHMEIPIHNHHWGDSRTKLHMIELWNPDGKREWHTHLDYVEAGRPEVIQADIPIKPEHTNRLWRITGTGDFAAPTLQGMGIPRVFSVSADRWFIPEDSLKNLAAE